MQEEHKVQ